MTIKATKSVTLERAALPDWVTMVLTKAKSDYIFGLIIWLLSDYMNIVCIHCSSCLGHFIPLLKIQQYRDDKKCWKRGEETSNKCPWLDTDIRISFLGHVCVHVQGIWVQFFVVLNALTHSSENNFQEGGNKLKKKLKLGHLKLQVALDGPSHVKHDMVCCGCHTETELPYALDPQRRAREHAVIYVMSR